ncbi:MAG: histidine kinase dimerization/phosphoacceptor domain-containing protein [Saprospiraceae bacterium]|nr:histidine kinase dimerization/phosphoacceptor domain-containing protein [Saprospiraceae bacterium]
MPVLLSGLLIWFLVFYQKKKYTQQLEKKDLLLKQQNLIIENQQAIEKERNRIASEMHDDLGSGLTTIKYLSERALKQAFEICRKSFGL